LAGHPLALRRAGTRCLLLQLCATPSTAWVALDLERDLLSRLCSWPCSSS